MLRRNSVYLRSEGEEVIEERAEETEPVYEDLRAGEKPDLSSYKNRIKNLGGKIKE